MVLDVIADVFSTQTVQICLPWLDCYLNPWFKFDK